MIFVILASKKKTNSIYGNLSLTISDEQNYLLFKLLALIEGI